METVQLKHCPICTKDLPVSEFGRNAFYDNLGAKDGKNIYCKSCVRKKVKNFKLGLKNWRHVQKERRAKIAALMLEPELQTETQVVRLPSDKVLEAIVNGARTQKEIRSETKLGKDEIGDAIANLLLWTKEIKTQIIDGTRLYFINEVVEKPIIAFRQADPFHTVARKANCSEVKDEKRIKRVA